MKIAQKIAINYIRLKLKLLAITSKRKAAEKAFQLFSTPFAATIKTPPPIFEKATPLHFKLNGFNIHGYRWNHPQSYKVLILHGFSSQAYKFGGFVEPLIKKGYEVLVFDAPAHGKSEGKIVNAVVYSEMIQKVIELFGPFNGFIAHSFGGTALGLALENINHNKNTKVVFIAPATETVTAIESALNLLHVTDQQVKKEIDNIIFEMSGKETTWFSIKRAMHNIKASVLWIHDEDDDITPVIDALNVMDENFPNIQFIFTKGLGHRKIYHDKIVKKKVIDFL